MVDGQVIAHGTTADILSIHELENMPLIRQEVYKTYGNGFLALDMLRSIEGRAEMVSGDTLKIFEEFFTHRTVTVNTCVVSATPGGEATFTLIADDYDSLGNFYPRQWYTVQLGDTIKGFIQAQIRSIDVNGSSSVFHIKPYGTGIITSDFLFSGAELSILDGAFAPETEGPKATSVGKTMREFYAQIWKEKILFGGMELARKKWHKFEGLGYFNAEVSRGEFLLDLQEDMSLLMGQVNTNSLTMPSAVTGSELKIGKNKGIWTWIDELGGEINYSGTTGFKIDDLDDVAEYLESKGITDSVIMLWVGGALYRKIENAAVAYIMGNGALPFNFTRVDGFTPEGTPDGALNIGFKLIKKGGNLFILHKLPEFTNPTLLGNPDYKLNDAGIAIPVTMVKDAGTGIMVPNLQAAYVGLGGYSRKRIVGNLGGMDGFGKQILNTPIIREVDAHTTCWLSNGMFPFVEAYKAMLIKRNQ